MFDKPEFGYRRLVPKKACNSNVTNNDPYFNTWAKRDLFRFDRSKLHTIRNICHISQGMCVSLRAEFLLRTPAKEKTSKTI